MADYPDKFYENVISTALMLKIRNAYGSHDKAVQALMKRKIINEIGCQKQECERFFHIALKVVDDALEFQDIYIKRGNTHNKYSEKSINETHKRMKEYLTRKNPKAHHLFIARSIARIYDFNYLR